ncbi:MAG: ABC transporter substrate-binding protein [Chloroflexi bacterium]|nr:ABC transporter substrate-binding protein [Chloroflexota bacterium]
MHRGLWLTVVTLCLALSLGLSAPLPTAATGRAAEPAPAAVAAMQATRINIGYLGILSDAPFILMRERGYLAEQGLEADYQIFDSGARMTPALATGQLDMAPGSPSVSLYNAVARGVNAKIVADWVTGSPDGPAAWIVVRQDLIDSGAVRDYADLRGRRVSVTAVGTSVHAIAGRLAERGGFTLRDLDVVELGYPDMLPALAGRSLDAAVLVEPFVVRAEEQGIGVRWRSSDELVPGQVAATVMYGPTFLEQRPDLGQRAMVAYLKALRDYYGTFIAKDPAVRAQIIPILIQATNFKDPALYDRVQLPSVNPDGYVNVDALEADYRWYISQGLIGDVVNLRSLVINDFVDYALQQLGPYPR